MARSRTNNPEKSRGGCTARPNPNPMLDDYDDARDDHGAEDARGGDAS